MALTARGRLAITEDGDTITLDSANGYLACDEEGWYAIHAEGTFGGSTTLTPYIRFQGSSEWHQIDVPNTSDQTQFVMPTHGKAVVVPGRTEIKIVTASYSGSSDLVVRRTKVSR